MILIRYKYWILSLVVLTLIFGSIFMLKKQTLNQRIERFGAVFLGGEKFGILENQERKTGSLLIEDFSAKFGELTVVWKRIFGLSAEESLKFITNTKKSFLNSGRTLPEFSDLPYFAGAASKTLNQKECPEELKPKMIFSDETMTALSLFVDERLNPGVCDKGGVFAKEVVILAHCPNSGVHEITILGPQDGVLLKEYEAKGAFICGSQKAGGQR